MFDFGPHSFYIIVSYIVTFVTVALLVLWVFTLERKQVRELATLEAKGVKRRSSQ